MKRMNASSDPSDDPAPRLCSSICAVCDGILVVGGRTNPSQPLMDPLFFDLHSRHWIPVESEGSIPAPRWSHSLIRLNDSFCVLFGGRGSDSVFGDLWSLHVTRDEYSVHVNWSLLYDSTNSLYNANTSPGPRFGACVLPLCSPSASGCTHDELLILGGMTDLDGSYDASSTLFRFKLSKRQWFTETVCDQETNHASILLPSLRNVRAALLGPNRFLLVGLHTATFCPYFLLLEMETRSIRLRDVTPILTPLEQPFLLTGFTVAASDHTLFLLGGGGVYFWMRHFNASLIAATPAEFQSSFSHSCSLTETRSCSRKRSSCHEIKQSEHENITIQNPKKLKLVKTLLENAVLYDKSRKITRLASGRFVVPVLDRRQAETTLKEMGEEIVLEQTSEVDLAQVSYSLRDSVERRLRAWTEQCGDGEK